MPTTSITHESVELRSSSESGEEPLEVSEVEKDSHKQNTYLRVNWHENVNEKWLFGYLKYEK